MAALIKSRLNNGRKFGNTAQILKDPLFCPRASQSRVKSRDFLAIRIEPVGEPKRRYRRRGEWARRVGRTMLHGPLIARQGLQGLSANAFYLSKFSKMLPI